MNYEKINRGSHKATFTPCKGTMVKQVDNLGNKSYAQINHKANFKAPRAISSTKIGDDRTQKKKTVRKGRYQPQMMTTDVYLRMSEIERAYIKFDPYYAFRPKK